MRFVFRNFLSKISPYSKVQNILIWRIWRPMIWLDICWTIIIQIFYCCVCSMRPHPILEKDEVTPRKKAYRPVAHFYSLDHLSLLPFQQERLKFSLMWKHLQKSWHFWKCFPFYNHSFSRNLSFLLWHTVILCHMNVNIAT